MGELPSGCCQNGSVTGMLEAAQCLSVVVMDVDSASAVQGMFSTLGVCRGFSQEMGTCG